MRITHLTASIGSEGGGVAAVVESLAQQQTQSGDQIHVLAAGRSTQRLNTSGNSVSSATIARVGPATFGYAPGMWKELQNNPPELLHVHGLWAYSSLLALRCRRTFRSPYVVSPHGMLDPWALNNSQTKKSIARLLFENRHLRQADRLHALCASEADSIRKFGLTNPICVVPNGVQLPTTDASLKAPWANRSPQSQHTLLFLGRIHPKKGLHNLISAWAKVDAKTSKHWSLAIAGWDQGGHAAELKQHIKELKLERQIYFTGPLFDSDKAAALQHADGFVLPSFSEGFPVAVLEAWSYGLPVVKTPECNIPEGFQANAAIGVTVEVASIAQGLSELFSLTREERTQIGQNGRELVEEKFTWDRAAAQFQEIYQSVVPGDQHQTTKHAA